MDLRRALSLSRPLTILVPRRIVIEIHVKFITVLHFCLTPIARR